ncbi:MAG: membrane protein insertion efficiency factor YidD [Patescibacteria group bacterium]
MNKFLKFIWRIPRNLLILLIIFYQKTISPDHSWVSRFYPYGYCKYSPSCSQYAKESLDKHGAVIGTFKAIWRVLRCNPCSKGGVDPA